MKIFNLISKDTPGIFVDIKPYVLPQEGIIEVAPAQYYCLVHNDTEFALFVTDDGTTVDICNINGDGELRWRTSRIDSRFDKLPAIFNVSLVNNRR